MSRVLRTAGITSGLALGFAVLAAGPVLLLRNTLNATPLKAEFQSIRLDSGGLVFRYIVHNSTRHEAHFQPVLTEVRTLQPKDQPPVGYPDVILPLDVPPHSSHVVEVRLAGPFLPDAVEEPAQTAEFSLQNALIELEGFELVDDTDGIRVLLPRGW